LRDGLIHRRVSLTIENDGASSSRSVEISVVVGSVESEHSIRDCLRSISESAKGHNIELIVADASHDGTAGIVRLNFPDVKLLSLQSGTLTPQLWLEGYTRSSGAAVAFVTGHCVVSSGWLAGLEDALSAGAAGAGGAVTLAPRSSLVDAAVYFLRYSAFMPGVATDPHPASEIAGDNSMYARAAISSHLIPDADGFWEVDINRRLRNAGEALTMVPLASISFGHSAPLKVISRHRFAHGVHSGKWRSAEGGINPWRTMLAAPLVPFVLLLRILRRVRQARGNVALVFRCAPLILWLGACWAAGEAAGARRVRDARRS